MSTMSGSQSLEKHGIQNYGRGVSLPAVIPAAVSLAALSQSACGHSSIAAFTPLRPQEAFTVCP